MLQSILSLSVLTHADQQIGVIDYGTREIRVQSECLLVILSRFEVLTLSFEAHSQIEIHSVVIYFGVGY